MRPVGIAFAVLAALLTAVVGLSTPADAARRQPNILVIQTDDENFSDLRPAVMPNTERFIVGHGTLFTHYDVATPLCCPSRASLLTGQYPHNDGVFNNKPGYGGLRDPASTLPAWLQARGYVTAHVGKFLNRYERVAPSLATPAPGWDQWFTIPEAAHYYDYDLGANGRLIHFGTKPSDHVTRVLSRYTLKMIHRYAGGPTPLYLELDERAPHDSGGPAIPEKCHNRPIPERRDQHALIHAKLPRTASFNEHNVSDKPPFISGLPLIGREVRGEIRRDYVCRLEALRGVDRAVGHIWHALANVGALRDTVVVFVSDNGYFEGQHRLVKGKALPYEAAIHQPLAIRIPAAYRGGPRVSRVRNQVANIDLAPTILHLAGGHPCTASGDCRTMDGRSLAGLMTGSAPDFPNNRSMMVELANGHGVHGVCAYRGVHQTGFFYDRYSSVYDRASGQCVAGDDHELYQLHRDSSELHNLYPAAPGTSAEADQVRLEALLRRLRDCSGIAGRDPEPASGHYCD
jgi:arylsulfatase A-like enzyme